MNMQLATILPTAYLHLIDGQPYHMALAHLIGKDIEYTEFYKRQVDKGAYVILDNGVIEGDQQSIEDICERAELIGAQEIILPDVFLNMAETLDKSFEAFQYVKQNYPNLKIMAVAQGETLTEWLECAEELITWDIDCLGVPKVLVKLGGRDARLQVLATLKDTILRRQKSTTNKLDIHLLGCWETPLELTMAAKAEQTKQIPTIRGCDSAIAYVYTHNGLLISEDERPSGAVDFANTNADIELLTKNIHIWEQSIILNRGKVIELL
jgi:hypothetical protein